MPTRKLVCQVLQRPFYIVMATKPVTRVVIDIVTSTSGSVGTTLKTIIECAELEKLDATRREVFNFNCRLRALRGRRDAVDD